jgi:predicted O-methyltransferase YrrM
MIRIGEGFKNGLFEANAYLKHFIKAKGPHGVHSPLVFELITRILDPSKKFYCFDDIESQRERLLGLTNETIQVVDYGAGSRLSQNSNRRISEIAKNALQPKSCAQALFKMVDHFKPRHMLELGTSLGVTAAYLAEANKSGKLWTIEGDASIHSQALRLFEMLKISNVESVNGTFESCLPDVLAQMKRVDFALIDGNHAYEPTLNYFHQIIHFIHEDSILVFDDIYWSPEMQSVWLEISDHHQVTLSLDFFDFGVLFFKQGRRKESFELKLPR